MKRLTHAEAAKRLRYCETELAKPGLTDTRRQTLEEKAAIYRRHLASHCRCCGRPLEAESSIAAGLGSTCRTKQEVAAR